MYASSNALPCNRLNRQLLPEFLSPLITIFTIYIHKEKIMNDQQQDIVYMTVCFAHVAGTLLTIKLDALREFPLQLLVHGLDAKACGHFAFCLLVSHFFFSIISYHNETNKITNICNVRDPLVIICGPF